MGQVGLVEATIDDANLLDTLRYRINYNEGPVWVEEVLKVDEISGSITITETAVPDNINSFDIEVIATVEDGEVTKVGSARIVVALDKNEQCSATPVEKTLTFVTVKEEQRHSDIFPMTIGDCEYELLSFTPNDKGECVVCSLLVLIANKYNLQSLFCFQNICSSMRSKSCQQ